MKSFLILILMLALLVVAFLTRPNEQSFRQYVAGPVERSTDTPLGRVTLSVDPPRLSEDYNFQDRYLWTQIERDGETVYVGAFSNWFKWRDADETQAPAREVEEAPRQQMTDAPIEEAT
jgi:hypothetical protein